MTTVRDPEILYAAFTQHIRRCPDCAVQTDLCPAAREFLHAWGEAERRVSRCTETDAFLDSDSHLADFKEAEREAFE